MSKKKTIPRININGQMLVSVLGKSDNHPYAKKYLVRCTKCMGKYECNSCDFHERKCPFCQGGKI